MNFLSLGELQGLSGEARPLDLYEDPLVRTEMRMVKRILGNAEVSLADVYGKMIEVLQRRRRLA